MRSLGSFLLLLLVHACGLALLSVPALGYHGGGGGGGAGFPSSPDDPYRILGVKPSCSHDEIRTAYRRRCLLTHPDKTLHLSDAERKTREDAFKKVQKAYELIGDPLRRQQYDASTAWRQKPQQQQQRSSESSQNNPFSSNRGSSPAGNFGTYRFDGSGSHPFVHFQFWQDAGVPRKPAYPPPRRRRRRSVFPGPWGETVMGFGRPKTKMRSVYVQDVPVALEDLYVGTTLDVPFRPGLFQRAVAAFRGGIGPLLLYQSLLFALPLVSFSRLAAACCAAFAFYHLLPDVNEVPHDYDSERGPEDYSEEAKTYSIRVLPGYKGGTKITYDEEGAQVVFVLQEREHRTYWRVGNDLHTSVTISPKQARDGCTAQVSALDRSQPDVSVRIPPGVARQRTSRGDAGDAPAKTLSHTMIAVEGQGWPIRRPRKDGEPHRAKGDLIVHVHVNEKRRRNSE